MEIGDHSCPSCHHKMDHAEATAGDRAPGDGDVGICIRCAYAFFYTIKDGKLGTRDPSLEEAHDMSHDEEVQRTVAAVKRVRSFRN